MVPVSFVYIIWVVIVTTAVELQARLCFAKIYFSSHNEQIPNQCKFDRRYNFSNM